MRYNLITVIQKGCYSMKKALSSADEELAYRLCEDYGKSQAKVAEFLGVGQATISRVVKEQRLLQEIQRRESQLTTAAAAGFQAFYEYQRSNPAEIIDAFPSQACLPDNNSGEGGLK